jgi:hypothetical protein
MDTREFGEKRIIELISNESEYGDDDSALFRLCRKLLGRGLVSRELAENKYWLGLTEMITTATLTRKRTGNSPRRSEENQLKKTRGVRATRSKCPEI